MIAFAIATAACSKGIFDLIARVSIAVEWRVRALLDWNSECMID